MPTPLLARLHSTSRPAPNATATHRRLRVLEQLGVLVAERRRPLVRQPYEALAAAVRKHAAVVRVVVCARDDLRAGKGEGWGCGEQLLSQVDATWCPTAAKQEQRQCIQSTLHAPEQASAPPNQPQRTSVRSSMFCGLMSTMLKARSCLQGGVKQRQHGVSSSQPGGHPANAHSGFAVAGIMPLIPQ